MIIFDPPCRCKHVMTTQPLRSSCVKPNTNFDKDTTWGSIMIDSCQSQLEMNSSTRRACVEHSKYDLFLTLPVFDRFTKVNYKNYFCAKCNFVTQVDFWKIEATYSKTMVEKLKASDLITHIKLCDSFKFISPNNETQFCIHREPDCFRAPFHTSKKWQTVTSLCKEYYFPVCNNNRQYGNPHCSLCNVFPLYDNLNSHCVSKCKVSKLIRPPLLDFMRPLTVTFEIPSISFYNVYIDGNKSVVKTVQCQKYDVYDPFTKSCRNAWVETLSNVSKFNVTESIYKEQRFPKHCGLVRMNMTDIKVFSNGSVYANSMHRAIYHGRVYLIYDKEVLVCTNNSWNKSDCCKSNEKGNSRQSTDYVTLQIISFIVGFLSTTCLVLLLAVYAKVNDYKNMNGKIITSILWSLLGHQVFFFFNGFTGNPVLCNTVAVVTHYFLLASLSWTNVLALDTFVSAGKVCLFV